MKMRTIYYLPLLCLVALAGCKKEDMTLPVGGEGDALVLNATLDGLSLTEQGVQSRAVADMTATDFDRYGFDIAGYYTVGDFDTKKTTAYPNVFDHDPNDGQIPVPRVLKGAVTADKFALKTVKWALTDNGRLSFFAWGQNADRASEGGLEGAYGITNYTKDINDKGYPWIDMNIPGYVGWQADIVGARVLDQRNDAVISAVDLEFHHLLSKLSFRATTSGPKITFSKVEFSFADKKNKPFYSNARYTFGNAADKLGEYIDRKTPYAANERSLLEPGSSVVEAGKPLTLGNLLAIPQSPKAGFAQIAVTYTVEIAPGVQSQPISRTLPVPAVDLQENTNHVFTLDFVDHDQIVFNTSIAPWTEVTHNTLPYVPGPRDPDVLIELDGTDAPFYDIATGKRYWLDRSGWNRHVELLTTNNLGYIEHDANNKCYKFNQTDNGNANSPGGIIPNLGGDVNVNDLTIEIISETEPDPSNKLWQVPIWLSNKNIGVGSMLGTDNRQFLLVIGESNQPLVFVDKEGYTTGTNRLKTEFTSYDYTRQKTFWTAQSTMSRLQLFRNGEFKNSMSVSGLGSLGSMNGLLAPFFNGKIYYLKATRKEKTENEVLAAYTQIAPKFRIPRDPVVPKPPHGDALILHLDGYTPPVDGQWKDQSTNAKHAEMIDDVAWTGSGYQLKGGYLKLLENLTTAQLDNVTVEIIFASEKEPTGYTPLVYAPNGDNASSIQNRPIALGIQPGMSEWSVGYNNNDASTVRTWWKETPAGRAGLRVLQGVRNKTAQLSTLYDSGIQKAYNENVKVGTRYVIGRVELGAGVWVWGGLRLQGEIKGVYIHNRALSDQEIKKNAEWYKAYYGLD